MNKNEKSINKPILSNIKTLFYIGTDCWGFRVAR